MKPQGAGEPGQETTLLNHFANRKRSQEDAPQHCQLEAMPRQGYLCGPGGEREQSHTGGQPRDGRDAAREIGKDAELPAGL